MFFMTSLRKLISIIFSCILISNIFCLETIKLNGKVIDKNTKEGIVNVNIYIPEIKVGAITNNDGVFSITFEQRNNLTLLISHIGYAKQSIIINDMKNDITIVLEEIFYKMDDVVITGTRTEKKLSDSPILTEVINKDEIINSGTYTLGELLELRSGVSTVSAVSGGSIVNLMGMDSKYILVLKDGQPIVGKFDSRISLNQISLQSIKKVEIIKGANSSLYGSEAMGGVINLISDETTSESLNLSYQYDAETKHFQPFKLNEGNRKIELFLSKFKQKFSYNIATQMQYSNIEEKNIHSDLNTISNIGFDSNFKWSLNNNQNIKINQSFFLKKDHSSSTAERTSITLTRNLININYRKKITPKWKFESVVRGGTYSRNKDIYNKMDEISKSDDVTKENEYELEFSSIYQKKNIIINLGSELVSSQYQGYRIYSGERNRLSKSIYSQLDIQPYDNWNFVLGIRLDNNTYLNTQYSPRLAIMHTLNYRWKLRALWSKGFRMPTSQELFFDWYHSEVGYKVIGNPGLKPEISESAAAGLEYYHPNIYRVALTYYSTIFNNMITDEPMENSFCGENWSYGCLSYKNINKVQYTGLEMQGSFNMSNDWKTSWNINYIKNIDLLTKKNLPNTQPLSSNINFTHNLNMFAFQYNIQLKWIAPYYPTEYNPNSGDYILSKKKRSSQYFLNYSSTWDINASLKIKTGIKNIFNQQHNTYGPFIGRAYNIKVEYMVK